MGKACAEYLKKQGMNVVLWDKQSDPTTTADLFITCDVTSEESVLTAMQQTIATLGAPRVCINCAGIAPAKRIVGKEGPMPLEAFKQVIDVTLLVPLCNACCSSCNVGFRFRTRVARARGDY